MGFSLPGCNSDSINIQKVQYMATDKKNDKETPIKPVDTSKGANPEQSEKKEEQTDKGKPVNNEAKSAQELEALQNGNLTDPVVVTPTDEQKAEMLRISEVFRIAYEGKGSFNDELDDKEMFELLAGKTDEEIVELVKPYFIFADASQTDNPDKGLQKDVAQAANIVKGIAALGTSEELTETNTKAKELMDTQNIKEIWHCPKTDYWFSREDYAKEHERKNKCSVQHYKQQ